MCGCGKKKKKREKENNDNKENKKCGSVSGKLSPTGGSSDTTGHLLPLLDTKENIIWSIVGENN